jgi:opacity protein-like surface antigen
VHPGSYSIDYDTGMRQLQDGTSILRTRVAKGRNIEMIRLVVATIALIAVIGSVAFAQDSTPKVQVFGGYSYVHVDNGGLTGAVLDFALREINIPFGTTANFTGWNAEGQYNFNRWIGIAADAGGRYGMPITGYRNDNLMGLPKATGYSFTVGPVLSYRTKSKFTPFVHALFGYDRASLNSSTITGVSTPVTSSATTYTDFAMVVGVGLDYRITHHLSVRLPQVDDLRTYHNLNHFYESAYPNALFQGLSLHQNNVRISGGVVVSF